MAKPYSDRFAAGKILAQEIFALNLQETVLVLAIPNGGLAVAVPIAETLSADLDLLIVRKLQIPYNPEAGFGAISSLGTVILNEPLVAHLGLSQSQIQGVINRTKTQIETRQTAYAGLVGQQSPEGRIVILVDDGLASGYTMLAAIQSVRTRGPQKIIVAVPTGSAAAVSRVRNQVDTLICPQVGSAYVFAVADAYQNWYDVPEEEVITLLRRF
ncbi:MAG: phosphoribosyltransferase, partial [Promethearchaeota archaeon]